jgi:deoxycytidylate deaminase
MNLIVPTSRQMRYFNVAKTKCLESTHHSAMVGSCIVKGNYVVSEGVNKVKSHTVQFYLDRSTNYYSKHANIHAEVSALVASGRRCVIGSEIYIYREDRNGDLANCRPCPSCMKAIRQAGIKHIFYTNVDGFNYERIYP